MNKKEVLEIRKQFSPENCAITRICGCYVDHEKEKKMEMKKPSYLYLKKRLSNILISSNIHFPERSERTSSTWNSHSTRN